MRDFIRRHRPAPGTVFGLLALIVALAGTAIADPLGSTSALNKKEKKQTRNIAKDEINKAAGALSVLSAQNATNATNATNAGQVDGHDAVCPAGTFLQSGVCFDTAVRFDTAPWSSGSLCVDAGGRLPTISELLSIRNVPGINLGPDGYPHWADTTYDDAGAEEGALVDDSGDVEFEAVGNVNQIRCAFNLVR